MRLTYDEIFGIRPGQHRRDPEARDYPVEKFSRHAWGEKVSTTPKHRIKYVRCKRCGIFKSKQKLPRYSRIGRYWSTDRPECIREVKP